MPGFDPVADLQAGGVGVAHVSVFGDAAAVCGGVVDDEPLPVPLGGTDIEDGAARARIERRAVRCQEVLPGMESARPRSER